MLTEKEVLNRALRALDGLGGGPRTAPAVPSVALAADSQTGAFDLKGRAVELWRDGERFFVVADEEDTRLAMDRLGARRGEVWTRSEVERVARLEDQWREIWFSDSNANWMAASQKLILSHARRG